MQAIAKHHAKNTIIEAIDLNYCFSILYTYNISFIKYHKIF
jgi:hypothetical protein